MSKDGMITGKIDAIRRGSNVYEIGRVSSVKDYILEVRGLENAAFYERVSVGSKAEGFISFIGPSSVTVTLIRLDEPVHVDDEVTASGDLFTALFSPDSVGHVVDMFGVDRLSDHIFKDRIKLNVINNPTPIMDRSAVNRPLYTGIAGVDLLYPIGKGQRQLILGSKKTGKTQVALDAIVNQKDSDMICMYIAIGKTKKEVKQIYKELFQRGAIRNTIILTAFQDDCTPQLLLTPQVGLSIAEYYMMQQKDVLVVIDDLSKHADIYREINLLAGKVPGRDAYPTDIFYAHASLLERGCQHKDGGSVTVLPIVETKSADITDYISTNVISITDGQLVLSRKAFEKGNKPAIDYGLSVSRLGGAVQTKQLRDLGTRVRRELLSYLETRAVFELANLDEMTRELQDKMARGKAVLELMNQYKFDSRSPEQIVTMFADMEAEA